MRNQCDYYRAATVRERFPENVSAPDGPRESARRHAATVYWKQVADDDVRFDWDQANAEHIARHSVKPNEAEQAIRNDPLDMNYEVIDGE